MDRRTYLRVAGVGAAASAAGCLDGLLGSGQRAPPVLEDRPDAVYVPTHVEGMEMVGTAEAGPYQLTLGYSYPHRFWLFTSGRRRKVEIGDDDTVHLMGSLRDPETGVVPPVGNMSMTIRTDGDTVDDRRMWPMLSQNMGFHFGDNVPLDGDGTYEVEVDVDGVTARTTGEFQGRFDDPVSTTVEFDYSERERDDIRFERLDDRKGDRDALAPMDMEMLPVAQLPPAGEYPGETVGEGRSGDARFVVSRVERPPEGIDGEGPYLAVSPRTPYNRYPLPSMSLTATVSRDGETVFDNPLQGTLDPALNYHYGAAIADLQSGDDLTVSVGAPPAVGRHEGYETAFVDMDDVALTV
jgi:hypothetical protein